MSEFEDGKPRSDEEGASPLSAPSDVEPLAAEGAPEIAIPEASPTVPPIAKATPVAPVRRPRTIFLARLVQALWLGSGVFLALAALAVFRTLAPTDAADGVGAMLARWHYIAILAPAVLIVIEWRRSRTLMVLLLFFAILLATVQIAADLRIRRFRQESVVPISSLDRSDPVRRKFGALHGFSSLMLLAQIATAIGVIAAEPEPDE